MGKKLVLGIATLFSVGALAQDAQKQPPETTTTKCERCRQRQREKEEEEVATVLANAAGIAASFFSMTQDPHNRSNIGFNLGNIVHGIGNIITAAVRSGEKIEEFVTSEEFRKQICILLAEQKQQKEQAK